MTDNVLIKSVVDLLLLFCIMPLNWFVPSIDWSVSLNFQVNFCPVIIRCCTSQTDVVVLNCNACLETSMEDNTCGVEWSWRIITSPCCIVQIVDVKCGNPDMKNLIEVICRYRVLTVKFTTQQTIQYNTKMISISPWWCRGARGQAMNGPVFNSSQTDESLNVSWILSDWQRWRHYPGERSTRSAPRWRKRDCRWPFLSKGRSASSHCPSAANEQEHVEWAVICIFWRLAARAHLPYKMVTAATVELHFHPACISAVLCISPVHCDVLARRNERLQMNKGGWNAVG